jgi:hypothetical protein
MLFVDELHPFTKHPFRKGRAALVSVISQNRFSR